jgi:hypothetical protein
MSNSSIWGVAREVLTILVIPLLGWGVSIEVRAAIHGERLTHLTKDLNQLGVVQKTVTGNSLKLARLEGKLDAANERLTEIKSMLAK